MYVSFNKEQFLNDAVKEHLRVKKLKMEAHYKGKKSRAKHNINKFSKKYNLSSEGYGFLDMFFGHIIMSDIGNMFSEDKKEVMSLAENALKACKQYLENEMKQTA